MNPEKFFFPGTIVFALVLFSWTIRGSVEAFKVDINKRFDCIENKLENMKVDFQRHYSNEWGLYNMERWSRELERVNPSVKVPDPRLVKNGTL